MASRITQEAVDVVVGKGDVVSDVAFEAVISQGSVVTELSFDVVIGGLVAPFYNNRVTAVSFDVVVQPPAISTRRRGWVTWY